MKEGKKERIIVDTIHVEEVNGVGTQQDADRFTWVVEMLASGQGTRKAALEIDLGRGGQQAFHETIKLTRSLGISQVPAAMVAPVVAILERHGGALNN